MMKIILLSSFFVISLMAVNTFAGGFRKPVVLAYGSDHGSYPADSMCFVSNSRFTPFQGGWIIPFTCLGGPDLSTQLWFVRDGKSQMLQASTDGRLLSKAYSDGQKIAWTEYDESGTRKLHTAQMNEQTGVIDSQEFKMPASWKSTYLNSLGFIEGGKIWLGFTSAGEEDAQSVSGEGYFENGNFVRSAFSGRSYYFTAESSPDLLVQKTRSGNPGDPSESQSDQIEVRLAPDFKPVVVLQDRDGDAQSKVLSIMNMAAVQGDRWSFIATVLQGTSRVQALIRGQGTYVEIFPLDGFFKKVDPWNTAILSDGRVAMRATGVNGKAGLWLFTGTEAQWIAGQGDQVSNEHGDFVLAENPFVTSPSSSGTDVVIGVRLQDMTTGEVMEQDVVRWDLSR